MMVQSTKKVYKIGTGDRHAFLTESEISVLGKKATELSLIKINTQE